MIETSMVLHFSAPARTQVQQLAMLRPLRAGLLRAPLSCAGKHRGLLMELQRMLAALQESTRDTYDPVGFCRAFRDFDGQPLAPDEQKDAEEFLNELFSQLEPALEKGAEAKLLDTIFGGVRVEQLLWQDEAGEWQRSEREPRHVDRVATTGPLLLSPVEARTLRQN